jgi:hypothetical protein
LTSKSDNLRYSIIPARAITDPAITAQALRVLALLGKHSNQDNGWCRRSQVKMAKELGCSRGTVQNALDLLVGPENGTGYIEFREETRPGVEPVDGRHPHCAYSYRVRLDLDDESEEGANRLARTRANRKAGGANHEQHPVPASLAPLTERSLCERPIGNSPAPAGASERWKEFRAAIVETWPGKFPSDDEAKARKAFERAVETIEADTLIACAKAHGAAKTAQKAKRSAPGEFLMKLPSNWLKECGFSGYAEGAAADQAAEAEIALSLGRAHSSLGAEMIDILRRIGMTETEMSKMAGATFLGGSQPCFTVVTPFQGALLRRHAAKLQRELGTEELIIVLSGSERRSA